MRHSPLRGENSGYNIEESCRVVGVEAGGAMWVVFAPPCVLAKYLVLFNSIRILSYTSLDLLDVLLIGKGKNESPRVLRINSKISHS